VLVTVPDVLTGDALARARSLADGAEWISGRITAGPQAAREKHNLQIPEGHPARPGDRGDGPRALEKNALFISAALPLRVFPPS
jgi:PKHD-type hydroxylase